MNFLLFSLIYFLSIFLVRLEMRVLYKLNAIIKDDVLIRVWWFIPFINTAFLVVSIPIFAIIGVVNYVEGTLSKINSKKYGAFLTRLKNEDL